MPIISDRTAELLLRTAYDKTVQVYRTLSITIPCGTLKGTADTMIRRGLAPLLSDLIAEAGNHIEGDRSGMIEAANILINTVQDEISLNGRSMAIGLTLQNTHTGDTVIDHVQRVAAGPDAAGLPYCRLFLIRFGRRFIDDSDSLISIDCKEISDMANIEMKALKRASGNSENT